MAEGRRCGGDDFWLRIGFTPFERTKAYLFAATESALGPGNVIVRSDGFSR